MSEAESTRGLPKGLICPNCGVPVGSSGLKFDDLVLCIKCWTIADRLLSKCRQEMEKTVDVYRRILVAAALERGLHLVTNEAPKKTTM